MSTATENSQQAAEPQAIWTSHSGLVSHRHCPQKWSYANVRRLERIPGIQEAVELEFGSWWAAIRAADALERGRRWDSLRAMPEKLQPVDGGPVYDPQTVEVQHVLHDAAQIWDNKSDSARTEWADRLGGTLPDRLDYVFARWRERWADEIEQERPLAVEMRWQRTLPGKWPGEASVNLVGYVDEVYLDAKRHLLVVRDDKAAKALGSQHAADDMMDSQLQLYAWGASPQITAWGLGKVRATAYDRARMTAPKMPKVTQMGSLSKSVTDYDLWTYLNWCADQPAYPGRMKDGSQAGVYQVEEGEVSRLSTPSAKSVWFQRTLVPLNENVIRAHLRSAIDSGKGIRATAERFKRDGEAARNLTAACRWCDFVTLCRAEMIGGPDGDYELLTYNLRVRPPSERQR